MEGADNGNGDGYEGEESGHCEDGECKEELNTVESIWALWRKL
jgi:hypothetical protein